jgi:hydrogenase nickel incorporation protein HypA/HybF
VHELYLAECILKAVQSSLPPDIEPERVEQVRVQVGKLDAVVPDSLVFLFDAIKSRVQMPNAALHVEEISVLCRCRDCGQDFTVEIPLFICPHCQSSQVDVVRGRGIQLVGISVSDDERGDDGHSDHS